jgi:predicted metal-dependent phosphoesterase TrpH
LFEHFIIDLLGYQFNVNNRVLRKKLKQISEHREQRAIKILKKLNLEFEKEGIKNFTKNELLEIQNSADGVLTRPHIADIDEASNLLRDAGGIVVLAHPNDPYGTSMVNLTKSLHEQTAIIKDSVLPYIDGIECWHPRNNVETTDHYVNFSKKYGLIMTGGSDCHQKPIRMGTVQVHNSVSQQFIR